MDSSGADPSGADFLHLGPGFEVVFPTSGLDESDEALLPPAKGDALESIGGLYDWYTALAIE